MWELDGNDVKPCAFSSGRWRNTDNVITAHCHWVCGCVCVCVRMEEKCASPSAFKACDKSESRINVSFTKDCCPFAEGDRLWVAIRSDQKAVVYYLSGLKPVYPRNPESVNPERLSLNILRRFSSVPLHPVCLSFGCVGFCFPLLSCLIPFSGVGVVKPVALMALCVCVASVRV